MGPNILSMWNLVYTHHRRNHDEVDSLLETTTIPNPDQAAPDIGIRLLLDLISSTTSLMILFNTDMLKIPLQHNILVNNYYYSFMYQIYSYLLGEVSLLHLNFLNDYF